MQQSEIKEIICRYIADSLNCTVGQLEQEGTFFVRNEKEKSGYLKILSIKDTNIISLSEDQEEIGKSALIGKNRDELYESNLIFGQTIIIFLILRIYKNSHFLPNIHFFCMKGMS